MITDQCFTFRNMDTSFLRYVTLCTENTCARPMHVFSRKPTCALLKTGPNFTLRWMFWPWTSFMAIFNLYVDIYLHGNFYSYFRFLLPLPLPLSLFTCNILTLFPFLFWPPTLLRITQPYWFKLYIQFHRMRRLAQYSRYSTLLTKIKERMAEYVSASLAGMKMAPLSWTPPVANWKRPSTLTLRERSYTRYNVCSSKFITGKLEIHSLQFRSGVCRKLFLFLLYYYGTETSKAYLE